MAGKGGTTGDPDKDKEIARKKSEAMKRHYQDPAFRERQSRGSAAAWKDPEYRAKISKARKEQHARAREQKKKK